MKRRYTVCLTHAELRALLTVASDGFEGIATDKAAAKAYLGGGRGIKAAASAMDKLGAALWPDPPTIGDRHD